jgi:hypothetical protein
VTAVDRSGPAMGTTGTIDGYLALELRFTLPLRAAKHMAMLITPTTVIAATACASWPHCQLLSSTSDRRPSSR